MPKATRWTDRDVEGIIGTLLRVGVLLAAVVVLTGGVIYTARHGLERADYRVFHAEPENLEHIPAIFREAMRLNARGIIQLGLLLLIATPIARVAFSIVGFAVERDRMYVGFTSLVLAVLLYSLVGS